MSTIEKQLIDLYLANIELLEEGLPPFVNRYRSGAIESFNLNGLPAKKNEKYKYSEIAPRYEGDYEKYFALSGTGCGDTQKLPVECYEIHLQNGYSHYPDELTCLENGIMYGSLRAATNTCPEIVEKYYNKLADNETDGTVALNTAFMQDGAFIYIPRNVTADKPFAVINCYSSEEDIYVYLRSLFVCGDNAGAKIIFESHTASENAFLVNSVNEVYAHPGSHLELTEIQKENDRTTHIAHSYVRQDQDSHLKSVVITTDGGFIRNNTYILLEGRGAENHTYGLYISGEGQHIDNYTNIEHRVADCTSFENYKGIASGDGVAAFNGRILVNPDAQRTQAFQENHNLLLSDNARIYTKPQLEIYADDVKCSHGATVGQLDPLAVFYMRQRGIGEVEARKLQMYGFVNDIIGKVDMEPLSELMGHVAADKIERL